MLDHLLAAPTVVSMGGEPFLARPLTLGDFGAILRNAGDAVGGDDPAKFGDEAVRDWMTGDGRPVVAWLTLRRDRPALTLADCVAIADAATPAEMARLIRAGLRRLSKPEGASDGRTADVAEIRWTRVARKLRIESGISLDELSAMTLDQVDLTIFGDDDIAAAKAKVEYESLADGWVRHWEDAGPEARAAAGMDEAVFDVHREASNRRRAARGEPPVGHETPTEIRLADLGLEIVPDDEGDER